MCHIISHLAGDPRWTIFGLNFLESRDDFWEYTQTSISLGRFFNYFFLVDLSDCADAHSVGHHLVLRGFFLRLAWRCLE
jgi:hypothetical protein